MPAPATQPVVREDLSSQTPVTATLGYAGSSAVTGKGGGTLTWLPPTGQVIRQGQVLYQTGNGFPVVLLYGSVLAWRGHLQDRGPTGTLRNVVVGLMMTTRDPFGVSAVPSSGWGEPAHSRSFCARYQDLSSTFPFAEFVHALRVVAAGDALLARRSPGG